ncbi:MAG TPA: IS110 family transposase [Gemmatimonadales bacterium]|nr:IS110 family transposase [Gemmatimonadales bacterium]
MPKTMRHVGLDVHAETIAVAVAEEDGSVREVGVIRNRPEAVRKLVTKLGPAPQLRVCYEAGPTGYPLYWQLTALGVHCDVIAPSLVPTKAGDRVKTDRKDAIRLARCYRAGDLTAIWVPDAATEALRDLVRAREGAKQDQLRARHRLSKFLLRHGRHRPDDLRAWTARHAQWLAGVTFELPTLQVVLEEYRANLAVLAERISRLERAIEAALATLAPTQQTLVGALATLRGVRTVTAATLVSELGTLRRFATPRQLMGYAGLVPREHSSGSGVHRGAITKTGNAHLRRVLVEAAWAYRHRPNLTSAVLRQRQQAQPLPVVAIATRAQRRLCGRYQRLTHQGKPPLAVATVIARELLGFIWAIGHLVEPPPAAVPAARSA